VGDPLVLPKQEWGESSKKEPP